MLYFDILILWDKMVEDILVIIGLFVIGKLLILILLIVLFG